MYSQSLSIVLDMSPKFEFTVDMFSKIYSEFVVKSSNEVRTSDSNVKF